MRITIVGANGRMGRELINALIDLNQEDMKLSGAVVRKGSELAGGDIGVLVSKPDIGIKISDDLASTLDQSDCVIDFSLPDISLRYMQMAAAQHKSAPSFVYVSGTTGYSGSQEQEIEQLAQNMVIVKSGNMSLGVNLVAALVKKAAQLLSADDFDIEILEQHHANKVDSPSGTAILLGKAAAEGRQVALNEVEILERAHHSGVRPKGAIGFASSRGGTIIGNHEVMFCGQDETISLAHIAQSRSIFAHGALKAARFGYGKTNGLYSMFDVLGLGQ